MPSKKANKKSAKKTSVKKKSAGKKKTARKKSAKKSPAKRAVTKKRGGRKISAKVEINPIALSNAIVEKATQIADDLLKGATGLVKDEVEAGAQAAEEATQA